MKPQFPRDDVSWTWWTLWNSPLWFGVSPVPAMGTTSNSWTVQSFHKKSNCRQQAPIWFLNRQNHASIQRNKNQTHKPERYPWPCWPQYPSPCTREFRAPEFFCFFFLLRITENSVLSDRPWACTRSCSRAAAPGSWPTFRLSTNPSFPFPAGRQYKTHSKVKTKHTRHKQDGFFYLFFFFSFFFSLPNEAQTKRSSFRAPSDGDMPDVESAHKNEPS